MDSKIESKLYLDLVICKHFFPACKYPEIMILFPQMKATLLGALFLVDFMYFEKQNQNSGGGGGFAFDAS